jgi:hypothetical protein
VIEIDKADELMDAVAPSVGSLPLHDVHNLFIVHFEPFATDIDSEEFYLFPMEFAFLRVTEELRFSVDTEAYRGHP